MIFPDKSGFIAAPAGFGKTQTVANFVSTQNFAKPILILTHTNSGVGSLRTRLSWLNVPYSYYKLLTIDSWIVRFSRFYPNSCGLAYEDVYSKKDINFKKLRKGVKKSLSNSALLDIVSKNYSFLIVDEYQDCSQDQHAIICKLSSSIPTVVLGDKLQGIYDLKGEKIIDWEESVEKAFIPCGELSTPHRWYRLNEVELGNWIRSIRCDIENGAPVNLNNAPDRVKRVQIDSTEGKSAHILSREIHKIIRQSEDSDRVFIIGDSKKKNQWIAIAKMVPQLQVMERSDLPDLDLLKNAFSGPIEDRVKALVGFAGKCQTQVSGQATIKRIISLGTGRAHHKSPKNILEEKGLEFYNDPKAETALSFLDAVRGVSGSRVYRRILIKSARRVLGAMVADRQTDIESAILIVRNEYRLLGRKLPRFTIGSSLLLKGLEAETVVVMEPEALSAKELYVALSRCSKKLYIFTDRTELETSGTP